MKRQAWLVLAVGSFLMLLGVSVAAAGSLVLLAEIPFEFSAGNTLLPAGTYTLSHPVESHSVLQIRSRRGRGVAIVRTSELSAPAIRNETQLIFNRYGDRYFLHRVWLSGQGRGYDVIPSSQEHDLAKERAEMGASGPQAVSVAGIAQ